MAKFTAILLLLLPIRIFAQVRVDVRMDQEQFLSGEPVVVVVNVQNVGATELEYSRCLGRAWLEVEGVARKTEPNIRGCYSGTGSRDEMSACFGQFPKLEPGERVTFRHSLEGHRLSPGTYLLQASGWAGVQKSDRSEIDSRSFKTVLHFAILPSDESLLRRAFARYTEAPISEESREAITSTAPPFLEKTIASFKTREAVWALAEINTADSRQDLRDLFNGDDSPGLRVEILRSLAQTRAADNLPFFTRLLTGGNVDAAYAIGFVEGDEAADVLDDAYARATQKLRTEILAALGNTRSRKAVTALIDLPQTWEESSLACGGLAILTHRDFCSRHDVGVQELKRLWKQWWKVNRTAAPIYGTNQCLDLNAYFPRIR